MMTQELHDQLVELGWTPPRVKNDKEVNYWCKPNDWVFETTQKRFHQVLSIKDNIVSMNSPEAGLGYVSSSHIKFLAPVKACAFTDEPLLNYKGVKLLDKQERTYKIVYFCYTHDDPEIKLLICSYDDNQFIDLFTRQQMVENFRFHDTRLPFGVLMVVPPKSSEPKEEKELEKLQVDVKSILKDWTDSLASPSRSPLPLGN